MIQETSFNLQTEINTNQDKVPDNCEFIMLSRIHIPKLLYQREFETAGSCKKKKQHREMVNSKNNAKMD